MKKRIALIALVLGLGTAPLALSHLENTAFHLSYRQSLFAILGANFGPMSSMIKTQAPVTNTVASSTQSGTCRLSVAKASSGMSLVQLQSVLVLRVLPVESAGQYARCTDGSDAAVRAAVP